MAWTEQCNWVCALGALKLVAGWLVELSSCIACRQLNSIFQKNMRKLRKWRKYGFLVLLARFLDDVSMTSSRGPGLDAVIMTSPGDVAVNGRSMGAMRWRPGGRMRDEVSGCGGDVHGNRARTWAGQVSQYRKRPCTVNGVSRVAPMQSGNDICPGVMLA